MSKRTIQICAVYHEGGMLNCAICGTMLPLEAGVHPACAERRGLFHLVMLAKPICVMCCMMHSGSNVWQGCNRLDFDYRLGLISPAALVRRVRSIRGEWQVIDVPERGRELGE